MILKQLEIQGFKSFPDKVKITFDKGVTAVVGPNGSGKSNLSDAIRWVLGETSSRQLRSAGKMEDVIFGGTARRGAMGYASVRLTLDNSDHALGLDAAEVTLGRRYYRAGDSEYTINGQVCRLKDIYELLLDTGIGRDGYSIIGQGRIAEIVAAKGSERREIFEDACGIARFRYRKTDAEHRLADAEANLERLRDILAELEGRVGPLEKEAEKARVYLELAGRRKSLEVTLWVESIAAARQALQQLQRDYETAQAEYERRDREDAASRQEAEKIRIPGRETMVLNPLREETMDSRLGSTVKNYYEGLAKETDFTEGYEDIRACVKDGAYKDTYVVFARYEMKIKDIYTKVPGLETLYVRKDNRSGAYRILTEHLDEDTKEYIQTVAGHEDVKELLAQMEEEYQEALASDALLKESLEDLKKAYEGSAAGA